MDTHQHVTPNICPALLRLSQTNGVVTFTCQLDADHEDKHYCILWDPTGKNPTEIYWDGDSRQGEWEDTRELLSAHMKNPPSLEQIASWLPTMLSEARAWALWQTYMSKASQVYKKPEWLKEN